MRDFEGARVGVTAGRQGRELVRALERLGAQVTWAPTIELVASPAAEVQRDTRVALEADPDWVVAMTGGGIRQWTESAGPMRGDLLRLLRSRPVAARGEKAVRSCRELGVEPAAVAASERGAELARRMAEDGLGTAVVQVDGGGSPHVIEPLTAAGATVATVRPYLWRMPFDCGGIESLLRQTMARGLNALTFTSPPAAKGLFEVAERVGVEDQVRDALNDGVAAAAVGAATSEALEAHGVRVSVCPPWPRTGALLRALARAMTDRDGSVSPAVVLDVEAGTARVGDRLISMGERELGLLASLARRAGSTCPTDVLLREVWGDSGDPHRLPVVVFRLRSRLGPLGLRIATVPKRGYRLETGR